MSDVLYVCLGAALGAPARYLADRAVAARHDTRMPWGTLAVNIVGSLVLGLLTGLATDQHLPAEVVLAVGPGLCGALTTYSTMSYETLRLVEHGAGRYAILNVTAHLTLGLGAAAAGYVLGLAC